jgi:hypothetical protein
MSKNASLGAYGIMYVVKNRKSEVIALLLKNGVVVPSGASDMTIALAVTDLLKVSKSFFNEFSKLLVNEDVVYGMSANMSGSYSNFTGFQAQTFEENPFEKYGSTTSTTSTTNKPKETKSTSNSTGWLNKGLELLQTGFQGYIQLDDNKTKRELADASVKISSDEVTKETTKKLDDEGMSTGAIIGLSLLGVTVVGLVVYLVVKNKNQ